MAVNPLLLTDRKLQDLNPLVAGYQHCPPGHGTRSHIREYTLLHFVYSGSGSFTTNGNTFTVGAGQVFLIRPGDVSSYTADTDTPWHYGWIGFNGQLSDRFWELPPVFSLPQETLVQIQVALEDPQVTEYRLAGLLLRLYEMLFSGESPGNRHIRQVENYIRFSYMQPLRIQQIAQHMNLDRRYLTRLFKQHTGLTIQEYLLRVRLTAAQRHLRHGYSVKEAAQLSGYEDVSDFSKLYKRFFGISPAKDRKSGHSHSV